MTEKTQNETPNRTIKKAERDELAEKMRAFEEKNGPIAPGRTYASVSEIPGAVRREMVKRSEVNAARRHIRLNRG